MCVPLSTLKLHVIFSILLGVILNLMSYMARKPTFYPTLTKLDINTSQVLLHPPYMVKLTTLILINIISERFNL